MSHVTIKDGKMNILICGTGWSGSGAIIDLLREYSGVGVVPGEFGLVADILRFLEDNNTFKDFAAQLVDNSPRLNRMQKNYAKSIKKYIRRIYNTRGKSAPVKIRVKDLIRMHSEYRFEKKELSRLSDGLIYARGFDDGIELVDNWIKKIGQHYGKPATVFDQPLDLDHDRHIDLLEKVFNPFKIVLVYRNLNDQLANIVRDAPWYLEYTSTRLGNTEIDQFDFLTQIIIQRKQKMNTIQNYLGRDKAILLGFENLVHDYESSKSSIESFFNQALGRHSRPYSCFKPAKSSENIGIWPNYLTKNQVTFLRKSSSYTSI